MPTKPALAGDDAHEDAVSNAHRITHQKNDICTRIRFEEPMREEQWGV